MEQFNGIADVPRRLRPFRLPRVDGHLEAFRLGAFEQGNEGFGPIGQFIVRQIHRHEIRLLFNGEIQPVAVFLRGLDALQQADQPHGHGKVALRTFDPTQHGSMHGIRGQSGMGVAQKAGRIPQFEETHPVSVHVLTAFVGHALDDFRRIEQVTVPEEDVEQCREVTHRFRDQIALAERCIIGSKPFGR